MKQERDQNKPGADLNTRSDNGASQTSAAGKNTSEKPKGTASPVQFPALSLPKGGGAIQGIGEKFQANPVTGTGSMSVPIAITPGRGGFAPQLALSYDSGAGNSAFGLGWDIGLPAISRKTQKGLPQYDGLPRYQDAADTDSDVFLLSGAEDLVPVLKNGVRDWKTVGGYKVYFYRPRIEGLFARIEKWVDTNSGDTHWRATTKDNLTSIYGPDAPSRIADPGDSDKVFSWLLERTLDHKGNVIVYEYKKEDGVGVAHTIFEKNRHTYAQQHLKRILYGNTAPYVSPPNQSLQALPANNIWLFELVFDYGEHKTINNLPQYAPTEPWAAREDAFSSYRAGFEIRDYRLCRRMLMFHRFSELGANPYLVKATLLKYEENAIATQLVSVTHAGYLTENGATTVKTFPPLTFKYTEQKIDNTIYTIAAGDLPNAPEGIDGKRYQWVDLEGEGLSGIFSQIESAWYYKRNLGDGSFGPKEVVAKRPVPAGAGVSDYDGNGLNDYVLQNGSLNGYFEMDDLGDWQPFRTFTNIPNIDWNDPNLRSLDLNGDGIADLLLTENDCFVWYPSKAKDGFDPARRVVKALDEEQGPRIVFQESFQTIFLADLSGSGMTDICRIRNGEVCYWPNLGYGRFGAKVTMAGAPHFDTPDAFDPARLRLADIDGAGPTDIVYLENGAFSYWINQSGNSWSSRKTVPGFALTTSLHNVQAMDLLGNGTSCIVWSSPLPGEANTPLRYIQLMGKTETEGHKPYLLKEVDNNMGAITRLKYEASTRFYLNDRRAGRPWITKLPFPVQVLTRQEVYDAITDTHFVSKYAYHHGYFDPVEREFRGFGLVEQWDTEDYDSFKEQGLFTAKGQNWSEESHIPPIHTKTWFHNGYYRQRGKVTRQYESEYYGARDAGGNFTEWTLEDSVLPAGLNGDVAREAARALKGRPLRVEVYADDASVNPDLALHPYTVTESNYQIKVLQEKGVNRHTVFYAAENETLTFQYERNPDDPRVAHSFAMTIDDFGNPTRSLAIVYPRRVATPYDEQKQLYCTYTEADFVNKNSAPAFYRVGVPWQQKLYEITGLTAPANKAFLKNDLLNALNAITPSNTLDYSDLPDFSKVQKRIVQWAKTTFYNDDLSGELPEGDIAHHGLPFKAWEAAYTDAQLQTWYGTLLPANAMPDGGFAFENGYWWRPSGQVVFDALRFYLPVQQIDIFGQVAEVEYDGYALLPVRSFTAIHGVTLETAAEYDYRTLQPRLLTDPNSNHSAALFDEMGMVVATAIYGKTTAEGDSLDGYQRQAVSENTDERATIYTDPRRYLQNATSFFYYDLHAWRRNGRPNCAVGIVREIHASEENGTPSPLQFSFAYSDGFGRAIAAKVQAEPGDALTLDAQGNVVTVPANPRWVGNGRTVFNNKGKPVKQYEPYFSPTWEYENETALVEYGVTPVLHYDPAGRVVRTDMPDGTFVKVEFTPWEQYSWDQNDTVLDSEWYKRRTDNTHPDYISDAEEQRAATLAAAHADTPKIEHLDTLGRVFLMSDYLVAPASAAAADVVNTHFELDIEGNQRSVTDALGRLITVNTFNLLGEPVRTDSMDAGWRLSLTNALGNPLYGWNQRGFCSRPTYDALQRPLAIYVSENNAPETCVQFTFYGERVPNAAQLNLLGQAHFAYDTSGLRINEKMDFKGNPLENIQLIAKSYQQIPDWSTLTGAAVPATLLAAGAGLFEADNFTAAVTYDALNRPRTQTSPDQSLTEFGYNEAGLLTSIRARLRGATAWTDFVTDIDYDAKGQRTRIRYGNGVATTYEYDPQTFRLTHLHSSRPNPQSLQSLSYYYDPVGNITTLRDEAQETIFYNNNLVEPLNRYTYDALYRLLVAEGREHIGQHSGAPGHTDTAPVVPMPNDGGAMRTYREEYEYDLLGNILKVKHITPGAAANWTRYYEYSDPSHLNPAHKTNRLTGTALGSPPPGGQGGAYTYDVHGNMIAMPHLPQMRWDYADQLASVDLGGGGQEYYTYATGIKDFGVRSRKVTEKPGGKICDRIYLGDYEVYRERNAAGTIELERTTLHIQDDKGRIALVDTQTIDAQSTIPNPPSQFRYQLSNHLGSACLEVDDFAAIISYEEYYPFGASSYRAGRTAAEVSMKRYRYVGKERDESTGLDYYGARFYSSSLMKFISIDPYSTNFPNLTLYLISYNNPIRFSDINGNYGGEKVNSIKNFMKVFRQWEPEALKNKKQTIYSGYGDVVIGDEMDHMTIVRVFNHDFTSKTEDQIVKSVPDLNNSKGLFSYYDKFNKFVDVGGFTLDIKHFMANVSLGNEFGEDIANQLGVDEEYWQSMDPGSKPQSGDDEKTKEKKENARTSAFAPEDLLSNALGVIFSRYDQQLNFANDLESFLNEAATLFSTNELKDGKFIKERDVETLRKLIKEHHGTDDFRNFQKNADYFKEQGNKKTALERADAKEKEIGFFYGLYLEITH